MLSKLSKSLLKKDLRFLRNVMPTASNFSAEASSIKDVSSPNHLVQNVDTVHDKRFLRISWNDGTSSRFPNVYLRDNCRCPECFDNASKQYSHHTVADLGLDIEVQEAKVSEDGQHLNCLWPGGHKSVFSMEWLRDMRMPEEHGLLPQNSDSLVKDELVLWDRAKLQDKLPQHEYDAVMNDDKSMFDFLYALYQHGIVLVDCAPARPGVLMEITSKIGWNRRTHLGESWDVKIEDDRTHLGSTCEELHFHTDLPYYSSVPSIQALHCILQSKTGGKNTFVDGFNVVKQLKKIHPEAFDILKNFDVRYSDEGDDAFGEYSLGFSAPVIKLNKFGRVSGFQSSHFVKSGLNNDCTPSEVLEFYDAYYKLTKLLYKSENVIDIQLQPGQIALFQNTRVMHGRNAFDATEASGARWLQGTFMDIDVIFSKLRVLQRKLGLKTPRIYEQSDDFF